MEEEWAMTTFLSREVPLKPWAPLALTWRVSGSRRGLGWSWQLIYDAQQG